MIRQNFETALKKGSIGENIVREYIENRGYVVYMPTTDGTHAFDMMAIKDKRKAIALDIKTKARRSYMADTGVNFEHYVIYRDFSQRHNMPFFLVFVDECAKSIYGNELSALEEPRIEGRRTYPRNEQTKYGKTIRYWPVSAMEIWGKLEDTTAAALRELSQRNYDYPAALQKEISAPIFDRVVTIQKEFYRQQCLFDAD